jgi:hypothetical protein
LFFSDNDYAAYKALLAEGCRAAERTGRPLGDDAFTARLEKSLDRTLARQKPGRKPRRFADDQESLP